jgi:acetyl-CoA C-acetyltransferase
MAISGLLESMKIPPESGVVDGVYMGMVLQGGAGQAPARQAALGAGLPLKTPATTLNKVCGSSLKAVMIAASEIEAGRSDVLIAGGMESMTNAPMIARDASKGESVEYSSLVSVMQHDGLRDAFSGESMGITGENIAIEEGVSRSDADGYALQSHSRASTAWRNGWMEKEAITMPNLSRDEGIRDNSTIEILSGLRPVFLDGGVVTAGNSSQVSDGAAALLICSEETANREGWPIISRIIDFETSGVEPSRVMSAPIPCIQSLLERNGLGARDIDLYEHNEAFATASCGIRGHFGIDHDCFNVHGGAVAMGHPLGASGARCLMSLLNALERTGGSLGIVTLCLGGGNAVGMLVSRD